jgi:TfoX/Sxy family transcriptional regulator of competence genes
MEMPKASEEMIAVFRSVAPGGPEAVERKMFGQLAAFVHGNMFMCLFGDELNVRLGEADRDEALAAGATPFAPMGRTMKGYVVLSDAVVRDREQLATWVARAYASASALPEKTPAAKKVSASARAKRVAR